MIIEKAEFTIISLSENQAERFPLAGDIFDIAINQTTDHSRFASIHTATITSEYVESMGEYTRVLGQAKIGEVSDYPCNVTYKAGLHVPPQTPIGEMKIKFFKSTS